MTVLVCGGRDYEDYAALAAVLDEIHATTPIRCIVHGGQHGADALGRRWAQARRVGIVGYHAEWDRYGRRAGPIRNQLMLDDEDIDLVVACPGGRGTADMMQRATHAGIPIRTVG